LGQFKDNKMHGKGRMDYANGDNYTGDLLEGNQTGQGVYMFASGDRYQMRCSNIICYYTTYC
jgi:hypothetical protein